jgi:hypothetical protein
VTRTLAAAFGLVLAAVGAAHAADWGGVRPGTSAQSEVRTQFGQPTKVSSQKVEGYDSAQWIYEGEQAPRGMVRVTVDFGLLTPQGYRADVVRVLRLEPRPGVFTRNTVVAGWGLPQRMGKEKEADVFFYESGLLVYFDKEGWRAQTMVFTPPQRPGEGAAPPRR